MWRGRYWHQQPSEKSEGNVARYTSRESLFDELRDRGRSEYLNEID